MMPEWTTERPGEPGFYWWIEDPGDPYGNAEPRVVEYEITGARAAWAAVWYATGSEAVYNPGPSTAGSLWWPERIQQPHSPD
jgi:hypothetical protein